MNIIFIGMPGVGKSTIARGLAKSLGRKFIDCDRFIKKFSGRSIDQLFKIGEDVFRDNETLALREVACNKDIVIATGGGVVERNENRDIMKDAFIIYLYRPIEELKEIVIGQSRPLLRDNKESALVELYERRHKKYLDWADYVIEVEDSLLITQMKIKEELKRRRIVK